MIRKLALSAVFFLAVLSVHAAPAPKKPAAKPEEKKAFVQNKFEASLKLQWAGSTWRMYFDKGGYTHTHLPDKSNPWDGTYTYEATTRTLVVHEKPADPESTSWMFWTVVLDKDNKGVASIQQTGSTVNVEFNTLKGE